MNDDSTLRPNLTIVGGQPNKRKRLTTKVVVPVGLEKILYHAAQNSGFHDRLMEDRKNAIRESGVTLRDSERAMLSVVSNDDLNAMIQRIEVKNPRKRKFMTLVAAATTSLAAGTAILGGCNLETDSTNYGVDAGVGPEVETESTDVGADAGVGPDLDGGL